MRRAVAPAVMFSLASLASCGPGGESSLGEIQVLSVTEVRRFGAPGLDTAKEGGGADVFGKIVGIAQLTDSTLVVLDGQLAKLVFLSTGGEPRRLAQLREGEGPGEIGEARDLARTDDGRLAVLDQGNRRISFFDLDGQFLSATPLPASLGLVTELISVGDVYWVTQVLHPEMAHPFAVAVDSTGTVVAQGPRPNSIDLAFGYGGHAARALGPGVLFGLQQPARFLRHSDGQTVRAGRLAFEDLEPPEKHVEGVKTVYMRGRAHTEGIGVDSRGRTLFIYEVMIRSPKRRLEARVDRFDPEGSYEGTGVFPPGVVVDGEVFVSRLNGHLYVAMSQPYPVAIEFEIGPS